MPTNDYGFDYPNPNDQIDGPGAIKQLADEVGPWLNMRFASVAARDAVVLSPMPGMRAWLTDIGQMCYYDGSVWQTENNFLGTDIVSSATFTNAAEIQLNTISPILVNGNTYHIVYDCSIASTVAGDLVLLRIREDSVTGTPISATRMGIPIVTNFCVHIEGFYTAVADGAKTFAATGIRSAGTGTLTRFASATQPANFYLERW